MTTNQLEKTKVGKYDFLAEPFHCDFSNCLFMSHLGNHMLNAADFHSNGRGFGMNYLQSIGKTWVLSRLAIEMEAMPQSYTRFSVSTWVESAMRYFTNRNFMVEDVQTGQVYGYGRSVWAMINTTDRQPTDILAIHDGLLNEYIEREKSCPIQKPSRVTLTDDAEMVKTVEVLYSDIDMNGHLNSIKYMEHLLNLWTVEWYKGHHLKRIEVAYVAECYQGDKLRFYRCEEPADKTTLPESAKSYCVRIVKDEDKEVCRAKMVFIEK